ncbi:AmmeMemoRadiSam system protein B [Candidatus Falkowbacteria bacterium CG11_big_fil_rev_8_21_14_0_20_39_10]|uniref:AmmeMemoRadiSam system protein B n=1 Tax=Candidatus Falkowbacteria bacterium CG11_big_fil_rev_8_21_14_0_20_39_10 TaxID=1974570 RepID=A0A2M6KA53_9BACT|nr:MAG: AmmeMemoRadiSam system protein B [Candidatus Falkowbacteria bacterium CG11_big_fil_rev_8_21_14_0_20_39_10]
MIIFSAITPHPPLLIPSIGKENLERVKKTQESFKKLEHDLYSAQIETVIIISPHGPIQMESFSMNLSPEFNINFEDFGDFTSQRELKGDVGLSYKIREHLETSTPLQLISQPNLDHGSGVPAYLFSQNFKFKIIPIYYAGLDLNAHFQFGRLLQRELQVSKNRIAVIASGDLSHRLTKDAPAGYSPKGAKFDQKLIQCLKNKDNRSILDMDEKSIHQAGECGLKSIVILLGILDGISYEPKILSYEAPFGVGYLTMEFKL